LLTAKNKSCQYDSNLPANEGDFPANDPNLPANEGGISSTGNFLTVVGLIIFFGVDSACVMGEIFLIISDFVGVLHCVFYSQYQRPERATSS
jgi:hypothetical protein